MTISRRRFLSLLLAGATVPAACSSAKQAPTARNARDAAMRFLSDRSWPSAVREAIRNSELYSTRLPSVDTIPGADGPAVEVFNPEDATVSDHDASWHVAPSVNQMDLWPVFSSPSNDDMLLANGPVLFRRPGRAKYLVVLSVSKQSGTVRAVLQPWAPSSP